ncbi:MAG: T9SS type A sorting domain-containing protein [Olleya sp.]
MYPNPTNDVLNIKVANDNDLPTAYAVYNMLGQLISENKINNITDLTIDAASFSNGMYFIKISKAGNAITLPFIKK